MSHKNGPKGKQRRSPYSTYQWKERKQTLMPPPSSQPPPIHEGPDDINRPPPEPLPSDSNSSVPDGALPFHVDGRREKKFANRARVFIGNLPRGVKDAELLELFKPYGEITQVYCEKEKSYGFARMAYRDQALRAIIALNGTMFKGRELRVRYAASSCSVKVSNLHPMVSNELLYNAFSQFGEVEYAVVVTDERGKSLCHGVVDYAKKSQALSAIDSCRHGVFLLTKSPIPVSVSELVRENDDGLAENDINKSSQYTYEREVPPRMAVPGTTEFDFGMRFKELYDNEQRARDDLEKRLKETREQLESEMEQFKHHEHANVLRLQLAEYQKEQEILQQRLHRHEQFLRAPPPPGPPVHIIPGPAPLPPPHGGSLAGQTLMPPPGPIQAPQPLLSIGDSPRGPVANPLMGPPIVSGNIPPFLLPSPGGQLLPPQQPPPS